MPMRAQYSRSRALAFTTCSSLRPEYPEPPPSSMSPSLGTWVLRERGRMATSSSSSCLRICQSTELLSLFRWQHKERERGGKDTTSADCTSVQVLTLGIRLANVLAFLNDKWQTITNYLTKMSTMQKVKTFGRRPYFNGLFLGVKTLCWRAY